MEKLLGTLTLGVIFRHFLSGGVAIASFLFTRYGDSVKALALLKDHTATAFAVAVVGGAVIYALHRGLSNPLLEFIRFYLLGWCPCWLMPDKVKAFLLKRWEFTKEEKSKAKHIIEWADYVQFLYTSALGLWLGSASAAFVDRKHDWVFDKKLFLIGLSVFVAGFVSDCRKHCVENELYP